MKLIYRDLEVGCINDVFESDGTWYGTFIADLPQLSRKELQRVFEFVRFSEAWNTSQLTESPRAAHEFEAFRDVVSDGTWKVRNNDNLTFPITDAPNFLGGGEVSWISN
jgi:hypothetical protein